MNILDMSKTLMKCFLLVTFIRYSALQLFNSDFERDILSEELFGTERYILPEEALSFQRYIIPEEAFGPLQYFLLDEPSSFGPLFAFSLLALVFVANSLPVRTSTSPAEDTCAAPGFVLDSFYNVCYRVFKDDRKSAPDAKTFCASLGAELLLVDSSRKRQFLDGVIVDNGLSNVYLQGQRADGSSPFLDDRGNPIPYFAWDSGQPTSVNSDIYLRTDTSSRLMEVSSGSSSRSFICEIPQN